MWREPAQLGLLEKTAINCLIFPPDTAPALRQAAEQRGLQCLTPAIWKPWKEVAWHGDAPIAAIGDGFWPDLALKTKGDSAEAGPTGAPWLDSNGWILQLARTRARGKAVWIRSDPPENPQNLRPENYMLGLCEAAAYGARRPLWIEANFARAIAAGNPSAAAGWQKLAAMLGWLSSQQEQAQWRAVAQLLAISTFEGDNEYNGTEFLNLAARRGLPFFPSEPQAFAPELLRARKACLYIDPQPMPAPLAGAVQPFVEAGGLFLAQKAPASVLKGLQPVAEPHPRFDLFRLGKGRVAISKKDWEDPWLLAQDAHLLTSRRYDPVRLFNAGSLTAFTTSSPDGKIWRTHLINYSRRGAAHQVSLQSWTRLRSARLLRPDQPAATPLEIHREPGQQEVYLPSFPVYAIVEMELAHA